MRMIYDEWLKGAVLPARAELVLLDVLDPTGLYRAAGRAFVKFMNATEISNDDSANVRSILVAGRDANLKELELDIEKDRFAGIRVGGIPGVKVKVDAGAAANGKVRLKATYK